MDVCYTMEMLISFIAIQLYQYQMKDHFFVLPYPFVKSIKSSSTLSSKYNVYSSNSLRSTRWENFFSTLPYFILLVLFDVKHFNTVFPFSVVTYLLLFISFTVISIIIWVIIVNFNCCNSIYWQIDISSLANIIIFFIWCKWTIGWKEQCHSWDGSINCTTGWKEQHHIWDGSIIVAINFFNYFIQSAKKCFYSLFTFYI